MYSLVIPVYRNEDSLEALLVTLAKLASRLEAPLEVVFVVDGSPDRSFEILRQRLPQTPFRSRLILHSRNFGSFAAIRTGLRDGDGTYFAVMAADLQEPPELIAEFFRVLRADEADLVLGTREGRDDPLAARLLAKTFWRLYRALVLFDMPPGGVDVFGCTRVFRDALLELDESNSSLVALALWMGFRRTAVPYRRRARHSGTSAWTFWRKARYFVDSTYAFSDLPIRTLVFIGIIAMAVSIGVASLVLGVKLSRGIPVPGYAPLILTIVFFGGLNTLGLGIIGGYVWRAYENTKRRPSAMVMRREDFGGRG
jgi:glycosyltransferase involved in cell wall biosynthesis